MKPDWMPPLPEADYLLAIPDQPYDRGYTTSEDGFTEQQMHDYAIAAVNAYENGVRHDEIRRAIAIAQAVEESAALRGYSVDGKWLMRRIDELMEGK